MDLTVYFISFLVCSVYAQKQVEETTTVTTEIPTTTPKLIITRQMYGDFKPHHPKYPFKDRKTKFYFEGVDYDLMPPKLHELNNDCRADFIMCIRYRTVISPVCGWDSGTWYFRDYHTPCEIELENCIHRIKNKRGHYGNDIKNNHIVYNGEGRQCEHYARMGGNMMDAYFGDAARRSADFNDYLQTVRHLPYSIR